MLHFCGWSEATSIQAKNASWLGNCKVDRNRVFSEGKLKKNNLTARFLRNNSPLHSFLPVLFSSSHLIEITTRNELKWTAKHHLARFGGSTSKAKWTEFDITTVHAIPKKSFEPKKECAAVFELKSTCLSGKRCFQWRLFQLTLFAS